jgi:predicted transcriptional regulator
MGGARTLMPVQLSPQMAEVARLYRAQWTVDGIAQKLGVSATTVRQYAHLARQRGADIPRAAATGGFPRRMDYAAVLRMWEAGQRQRDIATTLGVTQKAVSKALVAMARDGVVMRPLGRWPAAPQPSTAPERPSGPPIPAGDFGGGISGYGV